MSWQQVCFSPHGGASWADHLTSLHLPSKHSLGSHQYVQDCRKWESEISLQLLRHSTIRRDLARTVSHVTLPPLPAAVLLSSYLRLNLCSQSEDDQSSIDLEKHLGQVDRPFRENVTR